jgi:hypothetical protein
MGMTAAGTLNPLPQVPVKDVPQGGATPVKVISVH